MTLASSIILIAIGAILAFAVTIEIGGIDLDTVGVILMIVGVIGALLSLFIWGPRQRRATTVREEPPRPEA